MSTAITGVSLFAGATEPPPFLDAYSGGLRQVQVVSEYGPRPLWNVYIAEDCVERLNLAVAFAASRGILERPLTAHNRNGLIDMLVYLDERVHIRTVLHRDSAPYSFYFRSWAWSRRNDASAARNEWLPSLSGGVIYHGPGSDGTGAPEFSVRIGDTSEGWSIHT